MEVLTTQYSLALVVTQDIIYQMDFALLFHLNIPIVLMELFRDQHLLALNVTTYII